MQKKRRNEHGNVLWFILIAIALIAALTGILSRSGSSVDQSGDVEQLRIKIGQTLRYTKSIETAIQQMTLRGISENDVSFQNTITATNYTNANCTRRDCLVFDAGGGGLTYQRPFSGINNGDEWIFTAANNVGTTANPVGTTAARSGNDLIMLLPNANEVFCTRINRELDVGTSGTLPVETTGIATTAFTGAFPAGGPIILDGDPTPFELNGESAGCFIDEAPTPDVIYFYYTVLER